MGEGADLCARASSGLLGSHSGRWSRWPSQARLSSPRPSPTVLLIDTAGWALGCWQAALVVAALLASAFVLLQAYRGEDYRGPTNSEGRPIPQLLFHAEQRGINTMLQGSWWEPMDPERRRPSTKGPLGRGTTALVIIDMQPLFYDAASPWGTSGGLAASGMGGIWKKQLTLARKLAAFSKRNDSTFLTKFVPPANASEAKGIMKHYYTMEAGVTRNALRAAGANFSYLVEIMPPLRGLLADGARASTKLTGGAFGPSSTLPGQLEAYFAGASDATRTLIVTGVETDYCVISTILGAVDNYYRIIVVTDAISSSQPSSAQAQLDYTLRRLDHVVDLATTQSVLSLLS